MTITEVKIRRLCQKERLRAIASITIDGELAVHEIKVIQGQERLFVCHQRRAGRQCCPAYIEISRKPEAISHNPSHIGGRICFGTSDFRRDRAAGATDIP